MARLNTHSQHFLRSPRLALELIGHSNIRKNDTVYDLGAGSGVITSALSKRCKAVIAVENEPKTLELLRKNVSRNENVTVIRADILTINPTDTPYKIFSNIPFSLSSPIVRHFSELVNPPKSMYLIVQKQFAKKLTPGNTHFTSALGAEIGPLFSARIRKPLKRTDFTPPPAVDTVLIEIKKREHPLLPLEEMDHYRMFVNKCFSDQKYYHQVAKHSHPELRPSQLTPDQWINLYRDTHKQ